MNANEHLDFYNPDSIYYGNSHHYIQQLEAMLRQQQAEIEALKQIIDANNLNQNIGQFVKPTNEPVAYVDKIWIERPDLVMSQQLDIGRLFMRSGKEIKNYIPLYTHPYKPSKSEVDALLDNADYVVGIMRKEIEEWKRKYKDMHNLATQAMSKVHQLEKEAQET